MLFDTPEEFQLRLPLPSSTETAKTQSVCEKQLQLAATRISTLSCPRARSESAGYSKVAE